MRTILLVDDDALLILLFSRFFEDAGWDVLIAPGGRECLELLGQQHPDLILLDIMMPKMDGIEVLRSLAADSKAKAEKVVLLTNLAHDPVMKEALSLGAKAYLIKAEMTPDQLIDKLKGFL